MKNHVVRSFALLIAASLAAAGLTVAVSTAQAADATSIVVGSITDRDGYPLEGIRVDLKTGDEDGGSIVKTVYTNDAGHYRGKVPTGSFAQFALTSDRTGNHIGKGVSFELNPAGTTKVRTMKLYKAAVIRGSVTREDGKGTAGLVANVDTLGLASAIVHVSASGRFQVLVMPGTVVVSFGDSSGVYAGQCLDGSVPPEGERCGPASQIAVTEGQVVTLAPQVLTHLGEE